MLDFIRSHRRLMMIILALFVVPGLGLVGIQGFRGMFDNSGNAAKVGSDVITRQQFDAALRDQTDRARQMLGQSYDPKTFDTPAMRQATLDGMIQQRVVGQETRRLNLTASDEAVRSAIMAIPAIAALKRPDGSFDASTYQQLLAAQGMTGPQLDASERFQLASAQITQNIGQSALLPNSLAQHLAALVGQQRDVQGLVLRAADYRSRVQPSEAQIKQYYDAHHAEFITPESATIQYVVLSSATLAQSVKPTEAEIAKYYQDHLSQYKTAGEVRASHILITVDKNASADQRAAAKAKAEGILKQVTAHPDQFAALAKSDSQDPGSAAKGGDLGYFGRGMMLKPFEDAAFGLQKGQISPLVQTDFGYHIIEVTDVKPSVTRALADVHDEIVHSLQNDAAAKRYADDVDGFSNTVYEQGDSLQPAADKFGLTLQTASVTRSPSPAAPAGDPANNAKVLAAVFSDDVLKNKHNTSAIDLGNKTQVAARVTAYQPAALPPLEQVREAVRNKLVDTQAAELARQDGAARLQAFEKAPTGTAALAGFSPVAKVTRSDAQGVPPAAMAPIFKANAAKLPAFVGIDLPDGGGYAIYRINQVTAGAPVDAAHMSAITQQLAQISAQGEVSAYLAALRKRTKVKIYSLDSAPAQSADQ
ncbi:MAG: SurA N-terminal domain-containing protein [Janthinobacterium lividum]